MTKKITYRLMCSDENEYEFYGILGKFFASAEVRRDFDGYALTNDSERSWIVAFDGQTPVGFGSFGLLKSGAGKLYDDWVHPDYRQQGIHRRITSLRLHWLADHNTEQVKVVAYPSTAEFFARIGFAVENYRGKYAYMAADVSKAVAALEEMGL